MGYLYVALTILFTVYGQIVLKWQVTDAGILPEGLAEKIEFLFRLFLNPWIISAFASAFIASLAWMAAMTKFQLSYAYPFMSLNFVVVLMLSGWLFHEPMSAPKLIGVALIVGGIVVGSQG